MAQQTYKKDDPVRIVGGIYRRYKTGTYIGAYGVKMASIKVDGDSRDQRNLRLTSIRPARTTKTSTTKDVLVSVKKEDLEAILSELQALSITVNELQVKVKAAMKI